MEKLKFLLESFDETSILDCGTGAGNFIHLMTSITDNYKEIIGIDYNEKAVEAARKTFTDDRISFEALAIADVNKLGKKYDIVALSNSIHHLGDIDETLSQMFDELDQDGVLLFNEMYSDNLTEQQETHKLLHHFWAIADRYHGVVHNDTMTKADIISALTKHPKTHSIESWDMVVEPKTEFPPDINQQLIDSVDATIKRLEGHPELDDIKAEGELLKKRVNEIGFDLAKQVLVVVRKN